MFNKILISVLSTILVCLIIFFAYEKYNPSIHAIGEVQNIKWQCNSFKTYTNLICIPQTINNITTLNCNNNVNYVLINTTFGDGVDYKCKTENANLYKISYYTWFKIYDYKIVNYETESREEIIKINTKQKWLLNMNNNFEVLSVE